MGRKKLTPWQKIARAAERGTGTYLTAEDCYQLGFDDAIMTRASLDNDRKGDDPFLRRMVDKWK